MSQTTPAELDGHLNGPGAPETAHSGRGAELEPLIADILRTRECVPHSVFRVDRVDALTTPIAIPKRAAATPKQRRALERQSRGRHLRAIRLLLADGGGLCMQGILRPELHELVDGGRVYEGSLVRLDDFWLRVVQPAASSSTTRPTVFLILEAVKPLSRPRPPPPSTEPKDAKPTPKRPSAVVFQKPATVNTPKHKKMNKQPPQVAGFIFEANIRDAPSEPAAPETCDNAHPADSGPRKPLSTINPNAISPKASEKAPSVIIGGDTVARREVVAAPGGRVGAGTPPAWACHDLSRPLKLTPLRAIPMLPFKQNWMVNVLAVVAELSEPEPSILPPSYMQRTARLADPSTDKKVLLTVFLDPERFNPSPVPGSVVLLLGVKNHQFDGGSLKKYASDKPRNGGEWWLEAPRHLSWCDVAGLEAWWEAKQQQQQEDEVSQQQG